MFPNPELINAWTSVALNLDNPSNNRILQDHQTNQTIIKSFEVKQPLILPRQKCSVRITNHLFPHSYGKPFVGEFQPKIECGSNWSNVVVRFTASVSGRQFDRFGGLWFGGMEVLRFTTAEPSGSPLTVWTVEKDVTVYSSIFTKSQPVVLSLDNVVDDTYTGIFNVTVDLDFYHNDAAAGTESTEIADLVLPLSASASSYGWFTLPQGSNPIYATIPKLPNNVVKAQVEVFISGHAKDEFWYTRLTRYSNVPNEIPDVGYGGGSFKELKLFFNDRLIGIDWPFPTVYTGGFNPLLWRPVVAIGAFDIPTMKFDVTPFLPLLFKRGNNSIGFNVSNSANPTWFVDGNLLLWLDHDQDPSIPFNGTVGHIRIQSVKPKVTTFGNINSTLVIQTHLRNYISASGTITNSKGCKMIRMNKSMDFKNDMVLSEHGNYQAIRQVTDIYSSNMVMQGKGNNLKTQIEHEFKKYPFTVNSKYLKNEKGFEFQVEMKTGLETSHISQNHLIANEQNPRTTLKTHQTCSGNFGTIRPNFGQLSQTFDFLSPKQCYRRAIDVYDRRIVKDDFPECPAP